MLAPVLASLNVCFAAARRPRRRGLAAAALVLASGACRSAARSPEHVTPAAAGPVRLVPNWGVDTGAVARDYTGGGRANPVREVLAVWRAYLQDRPDSLHATPHWSAAEQRALPPGADYDLTRHFVFQDAGWARAFRPTVLDVLPAALDSSAWTVRTLVARAGSAGDVRVLGIVRSRVMRERGRWVLVSPLAEGLRDWRRVRVGRLAYRVAPGRAFDAPRAARAARFVDSLATAFGVAAPDSITYLVAGSADEAQRALGMDWALETPGRAYAPNRLLYSGNPALGEFYAHELAHVVLDPVAGAGVPGMAQEGVATWVGGSVGRGFPALMREYGAFLRAHPAVTVTGTVQGAYDYDAGWRPLGALLFQLVYERGGMPAVRALLRHLRARPLPATFAAANEAFAAAVAGALGVERAALDALVRARALRYAEPPPGSVSAEPGPAAPRVDTGTVAVNGTRLYYEAAGRGRAVVLLHGGNLDRRMWDAQFPALARGYRVVRYDLRGFGRSGDRDAPFQAHEDLRALLDTLGIARASLVGLSGGGRIAIDFALTYPDRVDRLVLAAPGLSGWVYRDRGDTAYFPAARRARDRGDAAGLGLAWLGSAYLRPAMERPELVGPLRAMAAANGRAWMTLLTRGDLERVVLPPALGRTAALRVPTLLIIGTRDTGDMRAIADTLAATVPGVRRVWFGGAGHMLNMEQPQRFTEVVRTFLRR